MGPGDSQGLPHRISVRAESTSEATSPQFSQSQTLLIEKEVAELQKKEAVIELSTPPEGVFHSTLFPVPKKDGSQRPVINLKALNNFVLTPHFKMEGIHTLKSLIQPED